MKLERLYLRSISEAETETRDDRQKVKITREHLRGASFASAENYLIELNKSYPGLDQSVKIAGIPFPPGNERLHTAITGSTGAGKSVALHGLLSSIRAKGDRAIVLDNNSEFLRSFRTYPGKAALLL